MLRTVLSAFIISILVAGSAVAQTCSLPNNLGDGANVDAAQVMADLNALLSCVNSMTAKRTRTVLTAGSGTYTPPSGSKALFVRLVGGGGGGGGSNNGHLGSSGAAGGDTTFGTSFLIAGGGGGGQAPQGGSSAGGSASGGDVNITGGTAATILGTTHGPIREAVGTTGGVAAFGGAGYGAAAGAAGGPAAANSGSGGGGAGGPATEVGFAGGGGGAGGYVEKLITSPDASYPYTVGTAGGAGGAGRSGSDGGAGSSGIIIIDEFY
jgi:hypothetical protein